MGSGIAREAWGLGPHREAFEEALHAAAGSKQELVACLHVRLLLPELAHVRQVLHDLRHQRQRAGGVLGGVVWGQRWQPMVVLV